MTFMAEPSLLTDPGASTDVVSSVTALAEAAIAAPGEYADPLLVFGGITVGFGTLILLISLFVNLLMGGADSPNASTSATLTKSLSNEATPDMNSRPDFLRRDARNIVSRGLSNLAEAPTGWAFGEPSPLYSNTKMGGAATTSVGLSAPRVQTQAAAVRPNPASPGSVPFGGRFVSSAGVPTSAPTMPVKSNSVLATKPVPQATAPAPKTATSITMASTPPEMPWMNAAPVVASPVADTAAVPVIATAVAVPAMGSPTIASAVSKPVERERRAKRFTSRTSQKPTAIKAVPVRDAASNPAPTPAASTPIISSINGVTDAPAEPVSNIVALTARVSELTVQNNQLMEMIGDLQRQINELKDSK